MDLHLYNPPFCFQQSTKRPPKNRARNSKDDAKTNPSAPDVRPISSGPGGSLGLLRPGVLHRADPLPAQHGGREPACAATAGSGGLRGLRGWRESIRKERGVSSAFFRTLRVAPKSIKEQALQPPQRSSKGLWSTCMMVGGVIIDGVFLGRPFVSLQMWVDQSPDV